ncbi:hypothetical protein AB0F30_17060 [Streptomyces sp. NPDC029006]|uniref:hypothetical protein n=1 Tax=Streptomyces sp. NPDC029006 TaxID=3155467 RepID=UPI0033F6E71A
MSPVKIFGREPSVILGLVAMAVQFVSAFVIHVGQDTQTAINVVAAAAVGLIVAFIVHDGQYSALVGLAQAALALAMNLGLDWSTDKQAAAMLAVTVLGQFWLVRDRVTAPVPAGELRAPAGPRAV